MLKQSLNYLSNLFRKDGFVNYNTGVNTRYSRSSQYFFEAQQFLDHNTLTQIYMHNGLGKRIVSLIVDEAIRDFIKCADDELMLELKRLKVKQRISEAASFGRLYGGSLLVCFVDDGRELYNPINYNNIKQIVSLRHYDRHQVQWTNDDIDTNEYSENYGLPEVFTVYPLNTSQNQSFRVHRSRCHFFGGDKVPNFQKIANRNFWDNSVLQDVYESLRNYCASMGICAEIIQDYVQIVLKVEGLAEKVIGDEKKSINGRLSFLDQIRASHKALILDSESEDYGKVSSNVSGLADLIDRIIERICADKGWPITMLSGRSPAGLNSTGEADTKKWNKIVDAYRHDELEPAIVWLMKILENQMIWTDSEKPESFDWSFPCLDMPSDEQQAKINLMTAQLDQIYIDRGAIDAKELAKLRYADGDYQTKISVEDSVFEVNEQDYDVNMMSELMKQENPENAQKAEDKANQAEKQNNDALEQSIESKLALEAIDSLIKKLRDE